MPIRQCTGTSTIYTHIFCIVFNSWSQQELLSYILLQHQESNKLHDYLLHQENNWHPTELILLSLSIHTSVFSTGCGVTNRDIHLVSNSLMSGNIISKSCSRAMGWKCLPWSAIYLTWRKLHCPWFSPKLQKMAHKPLHLLNSSLLPFF